MSANVLDAAKSGDQELLQSGLWTWDEKDGEVDVEAIVSAAAQAGHVDVVRWLIDDRFPNFSPHLMSHLAAISGGAGVYRIFADKWPALLDYDLGHNGNPIGMAILGNNKPMVEFLLSRGVHPNTAHFGHIRLDENPETLRRFQVRDDIVALLREHGFTPVVPTESSDRDRSSRCTAF